MARTIRLQESARAAKAAVGPVVAPMESKDIERRFRSGEVIVERGSPGRELFVVREGTVLLEESPALPVRLLAPGDVFGEGGAVLGRPHSVRALAEGEVVALALDVPTLNRLCAQSPEFAVRLVRLLAQRAERALAPLDASAPLAEVEVEPAAPPAPSPARGASRVEAAFAVALLRCARGNEAPVPVEGRLADLAREAAIEMLEAYACLQRLLERHVLRLVDDELCILELEELRALAG